MARLDDLAPTREAHDFGSILERRVFLAGSARHAPHFLDVESILQLEHGKLVSACSLDGLLHKDRFSTDEWERLQQIALDKLRDQDAMLVLDVDGYIGSHTKEEIEFFSARLGKPVYFLSGMKRTEQQRGR